MQQTSLRCSSPYLAALTNWLWAGGLQLCFSDVCLSLSSMKCSYNLWQILRPLGKWGAHRLYSSRDMANIHQFFSPLLWYYTGQIGKSATYMVSQPRKQMPVSHSCRHPQSLWDFSKAFYSKLGKEIALLLPLLCTVCTESCKHFSLQLVWLILCKPCWEVTSPTEEQCLSLG